MSIFRDFFVKEKPVFTGITRGIGGFGFGGGGGGAGEPGNGYKYHTFTTTGAATFTVSAAGTGEVEVFMVGGGGRGGTGGGGAGAIIYKTSVPISAQAYPLTIGAGGQPFDAPFNGPAGPYPGGEGGNSTAFGYTAAGGGHGGVHNQNGYPGDPGGSGGAGAPRNGGGAGSAGTGSGDPYPGSGSLVSPNNGWGNDGGAAHAGNPGGYGGGGGGAGGAGGADAQGTGGNGLAFPDFNGPLLNVPGLPGTYAKGGPKAGTEGTPGGGYWPTAQKIDGTGNGGGHNTPGQPADTFNGSSGVIVIRYLA